MHSIFILTQNKHNSDVCLLLKSYSREARNLKMLGQLKIYPHLSEIISSVKDNSLTIINTPTSSGKSIGVPYVINNLFNKRTWVLQPRVFLAKSLYQTVSNKLPKGNSIGLLTGKLKQNTDASLMFCTEGSFVNIFDRVSAEDIIIIDEVHEQGINTELAIVLLREHIKKGGKGVLMSATMDTTHFEAYFQTVGSVKVFTMPETERQHEMVQIFCEDEEEALKEALKMDTVLIGFPGVNEMSMFKSRYSSLLKEHDVFMFHSEMEEEEETLMLSNLNDGYPTVILATSIAMSGLTLNVEAVIPPFKTKRVINSILSLCNISESEYKQWMGRVARISKGYVFHKQKNLSFSSVNVPPQITEQNLLDTYIKFLSCGFDIERTDLLNKPSSYLINESKKILLLSGIIQQSEDKISLTEKGHFIGRYDKSLEEANLIYEGKKLSIENTILKLAELIKMGNPFRKSSYTCEVSEKLFQFNNLDVYENQHLYYLNVVSNYVIVPHKKDETIYMKGVKLLQKVFKRIDAEYPSDSDLTLTELSEKVKEVFSNQLVSNLFEDGYNSTTSTSIRNSYTKVYSTLAPTMYRGYRNTVFTTVLKK